MTAFKHRTPSFKKTKRKKQQCVGGTFYLNASDSNSRPRSQTEGKCIHMSLTFSISFSFWGICRFISGGGASISETERFSASSWIWRHKTWSLGLSRKPWFESLRSQKMEPARSGSHFPLYYLSWHIHDSCAAQQEAQKRSREWTTERPRN